MRPYSMDLRERVLRDSDAGQMADAVAERYHVSGSWVRWLKNRRRETGQVGPQPRRYGPSPKLAPHVQTLAALIAEQPDRTLAELQRALGISVSLPTICRTVNALGLKVKKRPYAPPNRSAPTSSPHAPRGTRRPRRGT